MLPDVGRSATSIRSVNVEHPSLRLVPRCCPTAVPGQPTRHTASRRDSSRRRRRSRSHGTISMRPPERDAEPRFHGLGRRDARVVDPNAHLFAETARQDAPSSAERAPAAIRARTRRARPARSRAPPEKAGAPGSSRASTRRRTDGPTCIMDDRVRADRDRVLAQAIDRAQGGGERAGNAAVGVVAGRVRPIECDVEAVGSPIGAGRRRSADGARFAGAFDPREAGPRRRAGRRRDASSRPRPAGGPMAGTGRSTRRARTTRRFQ